MMSGVATVTQGDQIGRLITTTASAGYEMVNVCLMSGALTSAALTRVSISSKNQCPSARPVLSRFGAALAHAALAHHRQSYFHCGSLGGWLTGARCTHALDEQQRAGVVTTRLSTKHRKGIRRALQSKLLLYLRALGGLGDPENGEAAVQFQVPPSNASHLALLTAGRDMLEKATGQKDVLLTS